MRRVNIAWIIMSAVILTSVIWPRTNAADEDAGGVGKLRKQLQQLETSVMSTNLRTLKDLLGKLDLTEQTRKSANAALDDALAELQKGGIGNGKVYEDIDRYEAAVRDGLKDSQKECLDNCDKAYQAHKSNCQGMSDPIDRANCMNDATNELINCQNNCKQ